MRFELIDKMTIVNVNFSWKVKMTFNISNWKQLSFFFVLKVVAHAVEKTNDLLYCNPDTNSLQSI